ncbi:leucine rich repeat protein, partial [Ichthyophthirius multifiliis]
MKHYKLQKRCTHIPTKKIQPKLLKQINEERNETTKESSQKTFVKTLKNTNKLIEMNTLKKRPNSPIDSMLITSNNNNFLPLKVGIVKVGRNQNHLNINNFKLGDQKINIFCEGLNKLKSIDILNCKDNNLSEIGMNKLIESFDISTKQIDFSQNSISLLNIQQFLEKYDNFQFNLQVLKLEKTHLSDQSVDLLCTGLQFIKSLRILNLSNNYIGNRSCYSIEQMIQNIENLRELYINTNEIQGEGGALIIDACRISQNVKVLDLSDNFLGKSNKNTKSQFGESLNKLFRENNEKSIIHLDLRNNNFQIEDCLIFSNQIKNNNSIIGFHFDGHQCFVNSEGFINQLYAKDLQKYNPQSFLNKRIDGCRFKNYNINIFQVEQDLNFRNGDNCWICEGWIEHTFYFKNNDFQLKVIYIHIEVDEYKAAKMNKGDGFFFLKKMIPSKCLIKFFFTFDGLFKYTIDNKIQSDYFSQIDNLIFFENEQKTIQIKEFNFIQYNKYEKIIDTQDDYNPLIQLRPRIFYQRLYNTQQDIKQEWNLKYSLFKDFKFDSEDLFIKCFEIDWECSKINQIVKTETQLQKIKIILKGVYPYIYNTYRYLSSYGSIMDVPCIQFNNFNDFINETQIIDNVNLKIRDLDFKFVVTNSSTKFKKNNRNPDKGLIRYQFMEIIVRLSDDKYIRNKIFNDQVEALNAFLDDGYLKALQKLPMIQQWRNDYLWNEKCDFCLKNYLKILKNVYDVYSDTSITQKQYKSQKYISAQQFRKICIDCNFINDQFIEREVNLIFNLSMITQVDEINCDKHFQMCFQEFIEAISRLADRIINFKLKKLIDDWDMIEYNE